MDLSKIKKIHFIGVGGIGVSAIAKMMLAEGKIVTGSDGQASEIAQELEKLGAKIFIGHQSENINQDFDLVIYSPAVPDDNLERQAAKKFKITQLSYPEFLGWLSKEKFTIAISGTNGKSTTTAMLGLILEKANQDPLVIVGSKVPKWHGNLRLGQGQNFVVEACEWRAHMLNLSPKMIVLTNLEEDHLDYYRDIGHIITTFQQYIEKLSPNDVLILNQDDTNLAQLKPTSRVITYGLTQAADVMAKNIIVQIGKQEFDLSSDLFKIKIHLSIKVPGLFNVYNVLAATTCALSLGVPVEIIKQSIENFAGIWRRFEVKSLEIKNWKLEIISDYAHHPTAVAGTIKAAKEFYPKQRLMVVFQPHHHNRTKKLFNEFINSFDQVDVLILPEIFDVAGREENQDQDISSQDLVDAIKQRDQGRRVTRDVLYAKDIEQAQKIVLTQRQNGDVILVMGAGDIYQMIDKIVGNRP